MKKYIDYFTKVEKTLWVVSVGLILISYFFFGGEGALKLFLSLLGVTSLLFAAKGNPIGPFLMIFFGLIYGGISYSCAYYGEMLTYVGMSVPMAVISLISWLKNPYEGNQAEVTVSEMTKKDWVYLVCFTILVTIVFYFLLGWLNTANLGFSTLSVTTSFSAVYLTYKRSPYFALAYGMNDLVLIVLWSLASLQDRSYISITVCFVVFFVNDLYSYLNWNRMKKRQIACSNENVVI